MMSDKKVGNKKTKIAFLAVATLVGIIMGVLLAIDSGEETSANSDLRSENGSHAAEVLQGEIYWPNGNLYYQGELTAGDIKENYRDLYEAEHAALIELFNLPEKEFVVPEFIGEGIPHGFGKMYSKEGDLNYEGEFKLGKKEGQGKAYTYTGDFISYEGEFKNDKAHGIGISYWDETTIAFEGEFAYGEPFKGFGYNADGSLRYEGYANGQGVYYWSYWPDFKYKGELAFGFPHGQGKTYTLDGQLIHEGQYQDGFPIDMEVDLDLANTKADSYYEDYDELGESNAKDNHSEDEKAILDTIEFMKEGAAIYPETAASAYFNIAMMYFDLGRYDEGVGYVLMSVERSPSQAYSYISAAAHRLFEDNQRARGNRLLEIGIEIDPSYENIYRQIMQ